MKNGKGYIITAAGAALIGAGIYLMKAALILVYGIMGASITIILPLVSAYLFVQGVAVYYRVKYEKEK